LPDFRWLGKVHFLLCDRRGIFAELIKSGCRGVEMLLPLMLLDAFGVVSALSMSSFVFCFF
jgi:hypothetical protein